MAESLITELKRRNVFKVAAAYLVLAWVVIQVTSEAVPALHLPEWVNSLVFLLGAIGFPFVLIFAWAFELTPEGLKRDSEVNREESITSDTGKKLNIFIIGLLVVALSYFVYESRFSTREGMDTPGNIELTEVAESSNSESQVTLGSSIAVLPFVNMSNDPDQEYFSDGISEEILNVLAKIPNLHVTSRSSAFAFKNKEINITEVANKLGVKNVLEGSVRKHNNRIRITAQLIEAGTDKHLWSETYDRELDDIFAIQDEISTAIVDSLKAKLGIAQEINITNVTEVNLDAHQAYIKGRYFLDKRIQADMELALTQFDKAIEIEPNYAEAWMGKAWANLFLSTFLYGNTPNELAVERAQSANSRALLLNPNLPEAHAIQGMIYGYKNERDKSHTSFEKAIELNPNLSLAYTWYSNSLFDDQIKRFAYREKAYRLDPISLLAGGNYTASLLDFGRLDEAKTVIQNLEAIDPDSFIVNNMKISLAEEEGAFGKMTYYSRVVYEQNKSWDHTRDYANRIARLGFVDEAAEIIEETEHSAGRHFYRKNVEMFNSEVRTRYPRYENDMMGFYFLAYAEFNEKNYKDAINYMQQTFCDNCDFLIELHRLAGNTEEFQRLLTGVKNDLLKMIENGRNPRMIKNRQREIAFLEEDMDTYMQLLFEDVRRGMPLSYGVDWFWSDEPIRQHPKWPEIKKLSDEVVAREREVYLSMVAAESAQL